mgnify:FL=1
MFQDTPVNFIEDGFQSDRAKPDTVTFRRFVDIIIRAFRAHPSEAEIAARQEYEDRMKAIIDEINFNTPASVRQHMHYY